jgi:hypothetical protein
LEEALRKLFQPEDLRGENQYDSAHNILSFVIVWRAVW